MRVAVYRRATFTAAHRLHNPKWSAEENKAFFGLCNNPRYHGHNYTLVVKLIGEVDPETGFVIDLTVLKEIIREQIIDRLDHKNLNLDVEEFKNLNPTAENIAIVIHDLLSKELGDKYELSVRLYETERNFVEYPAGS